MTDNHSDRHRPAYVAKSGHPCPEDKPAIEAFAAALRVDCLKERWQNLQRAAFCQLDGHRIELMPADENGGHDGRLTGNGLEITFHISAEGVIDPDKVSYIGIQRVSKNTLPYRELFQTAATCINERHKIAAVPILRKMREPLPRTDADIYIAPGQYVLQLTTQIT